VVGVAEDAAGRGCAAAHAAASRLGVTAVAWAVAAAAPELLLIIAVMGVLLERARRQRTEQRCARQTARLQAAEAELGEVRGQRDALARDLAGSLHALRAADKGLVTADSRLRSTKAALSAARTQRQASDRGLCSTWRELRAVHTDLAVTCGQLRTASSDLAATQGQLASTRRALAASEERGRQQQAAEACLLGRLAKCEETARQLEAQGASMQAQLAAAEEEVAALERRLQASDAALQEALDRCVCVLPVVCAVARCSCLVLLCFACTVVPSTALLLPCVLVAAPLARVLLLLTRTPCAFNVPCQPPHRRPMLRLSIVVDTAAVAKAWAGAAMDALYARVCGSSNATSGDRSAATSDSVSAELPFLPSVGVIALHHSATLCTAGASLGLPVITRTHMDMRRAETQ
jgi:hypothetical protein